MKLSKSIYVDAIGNEWIVQKQSLPKKKGKYIYWIADCLELSKCIRSDKKGDLIKEIEKYEKVQ